MLCLLLRTSSKREKPEEEQKRRTYTAEERDTPQCQLLPVYWSMLKIWPWKVTHRRRGDWMAKHKSEHQQNRNADDGNNCNSITNIEQTKRQQPKLATTMRTFPCTRRQYVITIMRWYQFWAPPICALHYSLCLFVFTLCVWRALLFLWSSSSYFFFLFPDDFSICLLFNATDITACGVRWIARTESTNNYSRINSKQ